MLVLVCVRLTALLAGVCMGVVLVLMVLMSMLGPLMLVRMSMMVVHACCF